MTEDEKVDIWIDLLYRGFRFEKKLSGTIALYNKRVGFMDKFETVEDWDKAFNNMQSLPLHPPSKYRTGAVPRFLVACYPKIGRWLIETLINETSKEKVLEVMRGWKEPPLSGKRDDDKELTSAKRQTTYDAKTTKLKKKAAERFFESHKRSNQWKVTK